jgi:hypothetical protein
MKLEIAGPEQSLDLVEFFKNFPVQGLVELKVDRGRDFFKPYDMQSDRHISYLMRDEETQKIEGHASFVVKNVFLEGQVRAAAFGRDLRISSNRKAILSWGQHFLPVMSEIEKTFDIAYFFSVLNLAEAKALNAFVRPRQLRRPLPRYFLFRRFNLVTLHGQFPWAHGPLQSIKVRRGSFRHQEALIDYIIKKSREKDLATTWDRQSFEENMQRWEGLQIEDFLIAYDSNENIVGCVAPWSSRRVQEYIPLHYSLVAHNFRQFLKFGQLLGWTRNLTKPSSRLQMEAPLNFRYLCFLNADNEDIFESLISSAYNESDNNEFLVYTQMRADLHLRKPRGWIGAHVPYGLYCMLPPDQPAPAFLHPNNERHVEVEPFFV